MNTADELDTLQPGPDPDKLERFHRQQLSAMLDGELSQDQARFLRRRLEHDGELSGCFERWQVCGDVLRGRQVSLLPQDFAERVARGIADGDVVAAPLADTRRPRLLRWGGGAALAASVALAALFVGRPAAVEEAGDAMPMVADAASVAPAAAVIDATADASMQSPALQEGAAAAALAGAAAVAVVEVPRRTERASRGQSQRAAVRVAQTRERAGTQAVAGASARAGDVVAAGRTAGAVMAQAVATETVFADAPAVARPWPKASTLAANSSFSVRYGDRFAAPSWDAPQAPASSVLPRFPVDPTGDGTTSRAPLSPQP